MGENGLNVECAAVEKYVPSPYFGFLTVFCVACFLCQFLKCFHLLCIYIKLGLVR